MQVSKCSKLTGRALICLDLRGSRAVNIGNTHPFPFDWIRYTIKSDGAIYGRVDALFAAPEEVPGKIRIFLELIRAKMLLW